MSSLFGVMNKNLATQNQYNKWELDQKTKSGPYILQTEIS